MTSADGLAFVPTSSQVVAKADINVHMVSQGASEINISFVIEESDAVRAVQALHAHFFRSRSTSPSRCSETKLTPAVRGWHEHGGSPQGRTLPETSRQGLQSCAPRLWHRRQFRRAVLSSRDHELPFQLTHVYNRDVARKKVDWVAEDVQWTEDFNDLLNSDAEVSWSSSAACNLRMNG